MRILYGAKTAFDITGVEAEVIGIDDDRSLKAVIGIICDRYPLLRKEIDDGDVLILHNGVLRSSDSVDDVKNTDNVEFAPVILGG
ncbi:MAG: MoaD/ThiS family protein [Candidatus Aenigmarchaeota archaeon]|nr:MoaD/ThiS family protein [Candidatus Aenigmarchaeota archaeon]